MNNIKDCSFLLLEEIPLDEMPEGMAEIVDEYRFGEDLNMEEAMNLLEEEFKDVILQWIQTNQELAEIFSEED